MEPHELSNNALNGPWAGAASNKNNSAASGDTSTELQNIWDETMKGVGGVGLAHRSCAVLLISWEEELDDLGTGEEVDELEAIFKNEYRYIVEKKQLVKERRSPQNQVQKILANFVYDYDDENTLLIVYYAGHGAPGKQEGQGPDKTSLLLAGNRQPRTKANATNSVVWSQAENIIKHTQGDVLVIFDCCHAGYLAKSTRAISERNFEFLAACGSDDVTETPGDTSFTSALIWSLKGFAKSNTSFTTQQLVRKINEEAPNFPRLQHALIMERGEDETSCFRKLVLAPLPKPGEEAKIELLPPKAKSNSKIKHYLDLRFFYDKPPTKDEIKLLAHNLKDMITNDRISARHIGWLKMTDIVRNVYDKWKRRLTVKKNNTPLWTPQGIATGKTSHLGDFNFPVTPPLSDYELPGLSTDSTPQRKIIDNVETSNIGNVESVTIANLESLTVDTSNISQAKLRRIILGSPDYQYRLRIFIVGLVVLLLECFHRIRPREAPTIVLLTFCGYASYMSTTYHEKVTGESKRNSSYFPLLIGGISLFICSRLVFTDYGMTK